MRLTQSAAPIAPGATSGRHVDGIQEPVEEGPEQLEARGEAGVMRGREDENAGFAGCTTRQQARSQLCTSLVVDVAGRPRHGSERGMQESQASYA
jgi:hypothetical protein